MLEKDSYTHIKTQGCTTPLPSDCVNPIPTQTKPCRAYMVIQVG